MWIPTVSDHQRNAVSRGFAISSYDLVCLDIMMPGMDGHEVLAAMRGLEKERAIGGLDGVKVIMTTALDDSGNILDAFRAGCEGYVTKPIERKKLVAELEKLDLVARVS